MMHEQQGFTLIEVMVALAILAMVAVAASQASGTYLRSVENLKNRTFGHFVAQNKAAMLQISPQWSQSPQTETLASQGRQWQVTVTPISLTDTLGSSNGLAQSGLDETIMPVTIQVAPISPETEQVQHAITDLTVIISNPDAL